jgi:phospholipid-binding lipoprotein MlaA
MTSDIHPATQAGIDSRSVAATWRRALMAIISALAVLCGGCATGPQPIDPWEKTNREFYKFNDGFDRWALKPAADLYVFILPAPLRYCLGNGFDNLIYFNVILNDYLQGNGDQGLSDLGRMTLNSTVGLGGLLDVATSCGMPAHENDFGITLGKWGVKPGPYLVIPVLGPSTARDSSRWVVLYAATPLTWLYLPLKITVPMYVVGIIDFRSRSDIVFKFRNDAALDPYVFTRDAYLQYRESRVHEGVPATAQSLYDEDTDSAPSTTQPATQPAAKPPD